MNHMDEDFSPVRKSKVAVNYGEIIQDTKSEHQQLKKLRNILLIPLGMNSHSGSLANDQMTENPEHSLSPIDTQLTQLPIITSHTGRNEHGVNLESTTDDIVLHESLPSAPTRVFKPRKKHPRQAMVFDPLRLSKIVSATSQNIPIQSKSDTTEPTDPNRLFKVTGHKQGMIPLLAAHVKQRDEPKGDEIRPAKRSRTQEEIPAPKSNQESDLSSSIEESDSSSVLNSSASSSEADSPDSLPSPVEQPHPLSEERESGRDESLNVTRPTLKYIKDNDEFMAKLDSTIKKWYVSKQSCACPKYFQETANSVSSLVNKAMDSQTFNGPVVFQGFYKYSFEVIERAVKKTCLEKDIQIMKISIPPISRKQDSKSAETQQKARKVSLDFPTDQLKEQFFQDVGKNFNLKSITETIVRSIHHIKQKEGQQNSNYIIFVSARDINAIDVPAMRAYWKILHETLQSADVPVIMLGFRHISGKPSKIPQFLESSQVVNIKSIKSLKEFQQIFIELLDLDIKGDAENSYIQNWRSELDSIIQNTNSFLYFLTKITYMSGEGPLSALFALHQSINHCQDHDSVYILLSSRTKDQN